VSGQVVANSKPLVGFTGKPAYNPYEATVTEEASEGVFGDLNTRIRQRAAALQAFAEDDAGFASGKSLRAQTATHTQPVSATRKLCSDEASASAAAAAAGTTVSLFADVVGGAGDNDLDMSFTSGFLQSVSMILVSELGDKTFFIAAILAMRHNRMVVFTSALGALAVMTVLSAAMGFALPSILPRRYTTVVSVILFLGFGFRLIKDAYGMSDDNAGMHEEMEEAEAELAEVSITKSATDMEGGKARGGKDHTKNMNAIQKLMLIAFSPIFVQGFTMTFLAEWGDRSQIATIALAAAKNPFGVTVGGIIGHAFCTGLAVVGGKMIANKISEKVVTYIGGALFLVFAVHSIFVLQGEQDADF
jgi:putative Ca2+/H+ antiporter (TMEM165/GDT1 family)